MRYSIWPEDYRSITPESCTFSMIKPDVALERRDTALPALKDAIEAEGFLIVRNSIMTLSREQAEALYQDHKGKSYYDNLMNSIVDLPVIVMLICFKEESRLETESVITAFRETVGNLRRMFAVDNTRNSIHASDSEEAFRREFALFQEDLGIGDD